jgi:hypothetical protein
MHQKLSRLVGIAAIALSTCTAAWAQDISSDALAQMAAVNAAKANLTPAQKKMDSRLVFGIYQATNDPRVAAFSNAIAPLSATDLAHPSQPATGLPVDSLSSVTVRVVAPISGDLNSALTAANGIVIYQSSNFGVTTVSLPVAAMESIAARPDVSRIKLPAIPHGNVGAVTSQGYVTHAANTVINSMHIDGTGVKVGVLSDSASPTRVAALIASGDLPAGTQVLPGQDGVADGGEDEGTAMMEIIHDMAPGAALAFATAFTSEESFADNIIALADAGCTVIVDDVSYFDEGVFQDSIVAKAVNTVTARGVIYFSAAANSGGLTKGTSGTYEGDFVDGGPVTGLLAADGETGRVHAFSATQNFDRLTVSTQFVILQWSDPLGAAVNDYDIFVLNSAGTSLLGFSADTQDGTGDPIELAFSGNTVAFPVNARIIVVKKSGVARAMHIDTERGGLSIATSGATFGHNAGLNTVSTAATYWNSSKTGVKPFTGFANTTETFSSDGPRKIFYNPDGSAITPNNFLFATNGGTTLQKPDVTAADGITTKTPGFNPFFGTSAAAPHAAAIAALVRAARPDYNVAQTKLAMTATALDTDAVGVDRDSGFGIAMATLAVQFALSH